jgi:hypothetical protein
LFQNGKFFLPPPDDGSEWEELFKKLVASGAGRPVGQDGFPAGPWTPELLADAISQIDSNHVGVDLRTVQLWFQDNDRGISATNIRWLARVFGCDNPAATAAWQVELSSAQRRLAAKRKEARKAESKTALAGFDELANSQTAGVGEPRFEPTAQTDASSKRHSKGWYHGLVRQSEAIFSSQSPLNLPSSVFAGASALGFVSYIIGIHSATYVRADNVTKEVGFLWAPNWTFLFMVLLPVFFAVVTEMLAFWKGEGRLRLSGQSGRSQSDDAWRRIVETSSSSYWAVFIICVLFAGVFQWIGVCLVPLLEHNSYYATSWGTLAIIEPDVVSVPVSAAFTALAYLYMCLCFYLFFAGLILLYTIIHDLRRADAGLKDMPDLENPKELDIIRFRLIRGIFRCTILGMLVALCMKAQSAYLSSNAENILSWLTNDMDSGLIGRDIVGNAFHYRMPTHYSSLLVAVSTIAVFLYALVYLRRAGTRFHFLLAKMTAVIAFLFASYMVIGEFVGFSIVLAVGALVALYGLVDPGLGHGRSYELGNAESVS